MLHGLLVRWNRRRTPFKRRPFFLAVALLALAVSSCQFARAQSKQPPTPQTQRGHDLFLKSPKGTPCATCHVMAGEGTAVGPDLTNMASLATPRGLVAVIQTDSTTTVQAIKTADGTFPGVQKQKQGDESQIWDLSQTPPVLRKLTSKDIVSMAPDKHWKHPPATAEYTSKELADIVGFLKWVSTGSTREIRVSDVE